MFSKHFAIIIPVFLFFTSYSKSDTTFWVKAGYYFSSNEMEASEIKSTLFTHLLCAFAFINSTDYIIFTNDSEYSKFDSFTTRVKLQNPSVTSLLSIYTGGQNSSLFNSLLNQSSYRKSFIDSSIRTARRFDFQGIDFCGAGLKQGKVLVNFTTLLKEWRVAITSEASNTKRSELVLLMTGYYLKPSDSLTIFLKGTMSHVFMHLYMVHLAGKILIQVSKSGEKEDFLLTNL
ncbi:putative glycoside hydrolase superfamily [Medicago truncatula]|uniref:Putative glycoside hydrolase superfamily n=1 Tax=Medicago truncatula TaxID=3880 RepID=A0A396IMM0_MEDTR|nr:putative glycoside hydrolase superfamily [Medicago truncatula]